jgi:hypothetical protein
MVSPHVGFLLSSAVLISSVNGHSEYRSLIPNGFNVPGTVGVGHRHIHGGFNPDSPPEFRTPQNLLNEFGRDFKEAGYVWTQELCLLDSDGDGESNGLELGDPCCEWREGDATTRRPWKISSPGVSTKPIGCCGNLVARTNLKMPNCDELGHVHILDESSAHEVVNFVDSKDSSLFWEFYYQDTSAPEGGTAGGALGGEDFASCALAVELLIMGFFAYTSKHSDTKLTSTKAAVVRHLLVFLAAVAFVDLMSGLVHLVLDNPLFNDWAIIGPAAVGFQHHHGDPIGVTRGSYFNFLREHHVGLAAMVGTGLFAPRHSRETKWHYLFTAHSVWLSSLMMASHRWAHTPPPRLPFGVQSMQNLGVIMSHTHHSLHHVGYKINYAIFTGWWNPFLNMVTANILSSLSVAWVYILVAGACLPVAVSWLSFAHSNGGSVTGTLPRKNAKYIV